MQRSLILSCDASAADATTYVWFLPPAQTTVSVFSCSVPVHVVGDASHLHLLVGTQLR